MSDSREEQELCLSRWITAERLRFSYNWLLPRAEEDGVQR